VADGLSYTGTNALPNVARPAIVQRQDGTSAVQSDVVITCNQRPQLVP
jgi:hypothetical protein